jgi:tetratricopeptide (TPR) repeat protein
MKSSSFRFTSLKVGIGLLLLAGLFCLALAAYQNTTEGATGLSAQKLFNQGNSYARQGKTGQAIAFYERAKMIDPSDANIIANLNQARDKASLPVPSQSWLEALVGWVSPNTWAWLGCGGLILIGVSFLCQIGLSRAGLWTYGGLIVGFVIVALCLADANNIALKSWECVVIEPNTEAHVSPTTNGETSFKLTPGQMVTQDGQYQDFILIADSNGRTGWVIKGDIMSVMPKS